jgi:uncharacterized protein YndB with AHSA1/START domain
MKPQTFKKLSNMNLMHFETDKANKQIHVKREFKAPLSKVWQAWTDSDLRDKWWAPKPWQAKTKEMNFKEGGRWLYAMVGPNGEQHWSRSDFKKIIPQENLVSMDAFCDSEGNVSHDIQPGQWDVKFQSQGDSTMVNIDLTFQRLEDLEKHIEMGFQGGFTMGLNNLDELLAANA